MSSPPLQPCWVALVRVVTVVRVHSSRLSLLYSLLQTTPTTAAASESADAAAERPAVAPSRSAAQRRTTPMDRRDETAPMRPMWRLDAQWAHHPATTWLTAIDGGRWCAAARRGGGAVLQSQRVHHCERR
jgi:hypothetical protein